MNIEHLKEFIVFSRYMNFARAAEELFIDASSLNRHITALSHELEIELLHNTRPPTLTKKGKLFLREASKLVQVYDQMLHVLSREDNLSEIRIAYLLEDRIVTDAISNITQRMNRDGKPVLLKSIQVIDEEPLEMVLNDKADVAVTFQKHEEHPDFNYVPFCQDRIYLWINKMHPLAKNSVLGLGDLEQFTYKFPLNLKYNDFHSRALRVLIENGVRPHLEYDDSETIDDFYMAPRLDLAYFTSGSNVFTYTSMIPQSIIENCVAMPIDHPKTVFHRYFVYCHLNKELVDTLLPYIRACTC